MLEVRPHALRTRSRIGSTDIAIFFDVAYSFGRSEMHPRRRKAVRPRQHITPMPADKAGSVFFVAAEEPIDV